MNTEQIVLALAIARERSITKAAESLFISQPAASSMLKKLEAEIGYHIFQRKKSGVVPTDEGKVFLEQALNIKQALHLIEQADQGIKQIDFSVLSYQLDFSARAFEAICERYCGEVYAGHMQYQVTTNTDEAARIVASGNYDVSIVMTLCSLYDSFKRKMSKMSLETVPIRKCQMALTCKKGHPIIQDGRVHYNLIREYPGFSGVSRTTLEPYRSFFNERLVGQTRMTYVMDPGPMRYRLLHKTNGFLFSLPISDEIKEAYDLESVILKDMEITVFAIFSESSPKKQLIDEYLRLCKDFAD
jgi:DNA-binding transcriptional LysR family regulator